eukprot:266594_1
MQTIDNSNYEIISLFIMSSNEAKYNDSVIPNTFPIQFNLHGQSHCIGIHQNMEVNELNHILKNEFNISDQCNIYGINCYYKQRTTIPLSNICKSPKFYHQQTFPNYSTGWELKVTPKYYTQKTKSQQKKNQN